MAAVDRDSSVCAWGLVMQSGSTMAMACGGAFLLAGVWWAVAQLQPGQEVEGFRVPNFDEQGQLKSQLFGDRAVVRSSDLIELENVRVELYRDGLVETRISSPHCLYLRRARVVQSTSSIFIVRGDVQVTGENYRYDQRRDRFMILTNAKVVIRNARRQIPANLLPGMSGPEVPSRSATPSPHGDSVPGGAP